MNYSNVANLSSKQLNRAAKLRARIDKLAAELGRVLGGASTAGIADGGVGVPGRRRRKMSAAARARIAAAQRARWARQKKATA